ncbi:MAG: GNAT family N-acetyltransferase [Candidatus Heimdallarchaeota archaeon]|nr:GNAT family N-acetyltransferase [Candidatus Heimdallarchaeota archaeon]MCK4953857.1 GNAT family N-acetyltransferase [Candidatus Heimdallarchaeota archaeon]
MSERIEFRELASFDDFDRVEEIQQDAWNMPDRELVPKILHQATQNSGGVVIGAFKGDKMIGYCWGWVGKKDPYGVFIYSHQNAVRKQFQNEGIGFQLKAEQRKWALKHNYECINWTFDPLQSKNCYLNLHKLGVTCNTHYENYWGEMLDDLNRGIDTDRFYCNWFLNSKHVKERLNGNFSDYSEFVIQSKYNAIESKLNGDILAVNSMNLDISLPFLFVQIPHNFYVMLKESKERIIEWREKTRKVFGTYFKKGYTAVDFIVKQYKENTTCYHVLQKIDSNYE